MKFGVFLVEQDIISAEQFFEAALRQTKDQVPLGRLAIDSEKLSKIHVLHILSLQKKQRARFGQIALDLGYLSKQDLADLFLEQDQRLRPIGEILVETGAITRDRMESALKDYRRQTADRIDPSGIMRNVV